MKPSEIRTGKHEPTTSRFIGSKAGDDYEPKSPTSTLNISVNKISLEKR